MFPLLQNAPLGNIRKGAYVFLISWILSVVVPFLVGSIVAFNKYKNHEFIKIGDPNGMKTSLIVGSIVSFLVSPCGALVFAFEPIPDSTKLTVNTHVAVTIMIISMSMNATLLTLAAQLIDTFNKIKRARTSVSVTSYSVFKAILFHFLTNCSFVFCFR